MESSSKGTAPSTCSSPMAGGSQMGDFVNNIHIRNPYEAEVGMTQHLSRVKFRKPRLIGKSTGNRNSIKM